jgi:hypothetical protein
MQYLDRRALEAVLGGAELDAIGPGRRGPYDGLESYATCRRRTGAPIRCLFPGGRATDYTGFPTKEAWDRLLGPK